LSIKLEKLVLSITFDTVQLDSKPDDPKRPGGNMFFTIANAPLLKPEVFAAISYAFTQEPHLLPASAYELQKSFEDGLALIGLDSVGAPIFYCRLICLAEDWYELGSTWTAKSHRGQGINKRAYEFFLPNHAEKNILATTTNKTSLDVGGLLGFVLCQRKTLPQQVWRATCSCPSKKIGASSAQECTLAWGEKQHAESRGTCWLRVTAPTAQRLQHRKAA